jgi:L-fuconolactonase
MSGRIDAHQHFWQLARGDYTWLQSDEPALAPLRRDFLPADLAPKLRAHGVTQTVLVQAAGSTAETDFMLSLAHEHAFIAGVVGWVDLADPASMDTLDRWAANPHLVGVRPLLQDLPEVDWINRRPDPEVLCHLNRLGLRFDALVKPQHLPALAQFALAHPELPMVIDHGAKPLLGSAASATSTQAWQQDMATLAALPNVVCKLSGLLTEVPAGTAAPADLLEPIWQHLLACFGPTRLMWGSDWPVLSLAGRYDQWVGLSERWLAQLSADEQASIWHGTARRFYGLSTVTESTES